MLNVVLCQIRLIIATIRGNRMDHLVVTQKEIYFPLLPVLFESLLVNQIDYLFLLSCVVTPQLQQTSHFQNY